MDNGSTANKAGDVSGNSVQVRDVHGGLHVHEAPQAQAVLPCRIGRVPPRAGCFQERMVAKPLAQAIDTSVLSGLGGVGKTQLAVDYAEQLWATDQLDLLMWITASSRDAIVSEYARLIAKLIGVVNNDPERAAQEALAWLASTSARWLIVLDDVQSPGNLRDLWPPATPTGRVVVTTRRRDAALSGHQRRLINVDQFTPQESRSYLAAKQLVDGADALADDLGHLPVALAQAAAYIVDRNLSCVDYRKRWADRRRTLPSLLPDAEGLPDEHRETVAATWSLSIERADLLPPVGVARPLLELASLLDPNGIPAPVFTTAAVLTHLAEVTGREITQDDAHDGLACLHRLSLLNLDLDSPRQAVRVHAIVQRAIRDHLAEDIIAVTATTGADALAEAWPGIERDTELAHVLRANTDALYTSGGRHLWTTKCHLVLFRAGRSLGRGGLVTAAADYFERLHNIASRFLGSDHPDTLTTRHNLAFWRGKAGDPAVAVIAFEDLLADRLRILGPDHRDTFAARSNLARYRGEAGYPAGAVAAYEALLADRLRILGPDHRDTLITRANLAYWRGEAGDPAGAVTAFEDLLADRLRILGPDHPDVLITRSNLAYWQWVAAEQA
jgi:hypothetical protein